MQISTSYIMEKQVCKICRDSISANAFGMHIKHKHKLSGKEYYHRYVNTDPDAGKCKMCGKDTYFFGVFRGYRPYCSDKCAGKDPDIRKKIEDTFMDHYGVKCNLSLASNREKQYATCEKKYGNRFPQKTQAVKDKCKKQNREKYGKDWFVQTDEFREKSRQTCLEHSNGKYEHSGQYPEAIAKRVEKFDAVKSKERYRATSLERYGVDNPMKIPEIRKKTQHKYRFDGVNFDSMPEIAYYIYLKDHNMKFEYQPNKSFEYLDKEKVRSYQPDFLVEGTYVEIKGKHFFDESGNMINPYDESQNSRYEAKYKCMVENNVKIISNYKKYIEYVSEKYGRDYLKSFVKK